MFPLDDDDRVVILPEALADWLHGYANEAVERAPNAESEQRWSEVCGALENSVSHHQRRAA